MSRSRFRVFYISAFAVAGIGLVGTATVPQTSANGGGKMNAVTPAHDPILAGSPSLDLGAPVWKLMDPPSNRHVIGIFDKDQPDPEKTIPAIPDDSLQPDGD